MASRLTSDLLPEVARVCEVWLARLADLDVHPLVYCTWRSADEQDLLYAKGRTLSGHIVTKARGWSSWHQMRRAWDAVPLREGQLSWSYNPDNSDWAAMVEQSAKLSIEWGGNWSAFRDYAHWQIVPEGLTLAAARVETLDYENRIHIA